MLRDLLCLWIILLTLTVKMGVADIENMPPFLRYADEIDCMDENSPQLPMLHLAWNSPHRAYRSAPEHLVHITASSIPQAGVGVKSRTFIRRYTWLAEYEGEIIRKLSQISDYAWKVKRNGYPYYYIDAHNIRTSNWLRWINCSRRESEENVIMLACKGRVYYVTAKDIHPGQELFVYYGDVYAQDLNIDLTEYHGTETLSGHGAGEESKQA